MVLVWDWESARSQRNAIGPVDTEPLTIAKAWHASLFELGVTTDFVWPGHDLSRYKVIIVPSLFAIADSFAVDLANAVRRGARVLVTCLSGIVDADGHAQLGGHLGPLAPLLGVRVLDFSPIAVTPYAGEIKSGGSLDGPTLDPLYEPISAMVGTPPGFQQWTWSPPGWSASAVRRSGGLRKSTCPMAVGQWSMLRSPGRTPPVGRQ